MTNNRSMDFSVDRENNRIKVQRAFAAPLANVWAAWTEAEYLDQWWAPKPWRAETSHLDFTVGGYWLYAMIGPDGTRHYARADYKSIVPQKSYSGLDAFCDEHGTVTDTFPRSLWEVKFEDAGNTTMVHITTTYERLEDLETILRMGFREGFTAALGNLDELLANQAG